jgi:amylosucrase
VPQVFPKVSPGNFTYYDKQKKWVWTSFYEFQWDLNYRNPLVFNGMIENLLYLMNKGVDMLRLDAIPFMWKEMWTTCRNLHEIHPLLRMFQVITRMVAPSVALLGEAIMKPDEIITYFGHGEKVECNILYNASYMVDIWNAIASRDGRSLGYAIPRAIPEDTYWINYARCHDDIGWGIDTPVINEMGFNEYHHKQFLINFYQGNFYDSFARGRLYEFDPVTMDARNSGTMASLAGLEVAVFDKNDMLRDVAIRRIKLIHSLFLFARGIPMMYSGDEIGMLNDYSYETVPSKAHDSRWLHRGKFDWAAAESEGTTAETISNEIKSLIKLRKRNPIFDGQATQTNLRLFNKHVFAFIRRSPDPEVKPLVALFNFADTAQLIGTFDIKQHDINGKLTNLLTRKKIDLKNDTILIGPQEVILLQ